MDMKKSLLIWSLIFLIFLAIAKTHYILNFLLIGQWVVGLTDWYWWVYIFGLLTINLAVSLYSRFKYLGFFISVPLLFVLTCKALIHLILYAVWGINTLIPFFLVVLLSSFFVAQFYFWGCNKAHIIILMCVLIVVSIPFALDYSKSVMARKPLTYASSATSTQPIISHFWHL